MLELTMGGRCISGLDAITFFESLPEFLPEKLKTDEFCNEYEYALNRIRYEVSQSIPIAPRVDKGHFISYICGKCGAGVDRSTNKYCPKCGRAIAWEELERKIGGNDGIRIIKGSSNEERVKRWITKS